MTNELFFDGKKHISSSRSAQLSGYTNDYLARLCREQEIKGALLGSTWYLELDSLFAYLDTKFVTSMDASQIAGCSNDYLSRLCRKGKLRGRRINGAWYIYRDAFSDYLKAKSAKMTARAATVAALVREEFVSSLAGNLEQTEKEKSFPDAKDTKNIPQLPRTSSRNKK